ncbi:acyltransferase family protein [Cellvibrio sp.]
MLLNQVLNPRNNNFDLFRLIAALLVIYGHASGLVHVPNVVNSDFVASLLRFDYSGSLAVKFFFMLSGLLVTASFLSRPHVGEFIIKRAARILPGLFVCLCISVFVIGPWFTTLSLPEYFANSQTWNYLINNTLLYQLEWRLPGVFADSKYGLNGSLWTLPLEVVCYLFLAAVYGLGIWRIQWLTNLVLLGVIFLSFFMPEFLTPVFAGNKEAHLLPGCFALGALFATNQNLIVINKQGALALVLLTALLWATSLKLVLFYLCFFYCCLYLGSRKAVVEKLKIPADPSYGVYIYGFLIQQCLGHLFPQQGVLFNQIVAAIIALIAGILSWYYIEKPSIRLAKSFLAQEKEFAMLKLKTENWLARCTESITGKGALRLVGLMAIAWLAYFVSLYFIFPGYFDPLSFHHSDFYIPAAFANAPGEYYSFTSLLNWPRPLLMWALKFGGYFGHAGSVAWLVAMVFLNCALTALLFKRLLALTIDWRFYLFFALYCYLLFTQPYFYTFYSQDIGSQLSYLFLLVGFIALLEFIDRSKFAAFSVLFVLTTSAMLMKETYALSIGFVTFCWFIFYVKQNWLKAILPGVAVICGGIVSAVVNFKTNSVFVNLSAEQGSAYHIDISILSLAKEMARYAREGVTPLLVIVLGLILFQIYKTYKDKLWVRSFLLCLVFALLAWLPNALLPHHHYEGYSFNGLYVCFAVLFFAVKIAQEYGHSKKIFWAIVIFTLLSPLTSIKKYQSTRNTWVLAMENVQMNLLAGITKATAQLVPLDKNITVLVTGISAPFHPFAFPESLRSFAGGNKAEYYFVVPKDFPDKVGMKIDLVNYIKESDKANVAYDQEWQFDDQGNLVAITSKKE